MIIARVFEYEVGGMLKIFQSPFSRRWFVSGLLFGSPRGNHDHQAESQKDHQGA